MAYSKQTFTLNQILTAAQMNQVEDNISDHDHSDSGVAIVKIGVSADDTTPHYLETKILGGAGITIVTIAPGGDEDLSISISANGVDSANIVAGAIDLAHMSANSVDSAQYVDGSIDLAHMSANSVDSAQYVDGSIDNAHIASAQINSNHYVNGSIDLAHMSANSVDSAQLVAASVKQGELSTALQQSSASISALGIAEITFTGGTYNFMAGIGSSAFGSSAQGDIDGMTITPHNNGAYQNVIAIMNTQSGASDTYFFQSRYIQASPPYDLGDGEIPLFIFVIIDNSTGDIVGVDIAADPPWANNGPTDIRADRIDEEGKKFRTVRTSPITIANIKSGAATIQDLLDSSPVETEIEITAEFKNSDMNIIPHPWGNTDMSGKTLALMDPIDDSVMMKLMDLYIAGDDVAELFMGNYLRAGAAISRASPNGVSQVRFVK